MTVSIQVYLAALWAISGALHKDTWALALMEIEQW